MAKTFLISVIFGVSLTSSAMAGCEDIIGRTPGQPVQIGRYVVELVSLRIRTNKNKCTLAEAQRLPKDESQGWIPVFLNGKKTPLVMTGNPQATTHWAKQRVFNRQEFQFRRQDGKPFSLRFRKALDLINKYCATFDKKGAMTQRAPYGGGRQKMQHFDGNCQ